MVSAPRMRPGPTVPGRVGRGRWSGDTRWKDHIVGRPILVVSASTGTGHRRAGEAIRERFVSCAPPAYVAHVDLLDLAPRWIRATVGNGYELLATHTPRIWDQLYRRSDVPSPDLARWGPAIHRTLFREFRRLLLSRDWGACVCTHFLPGQLAAGTPGAPWFAMVVTDLTLHHFWSQPRVPQYFVANVGLADGLRARVPRSAVDVTGIPVSQRFAEAPSRTEARAALGLPPDAPTVVVMGGGLGTGIEAMATSVVQANAPGLRVVAVCGRNEEARKRLEDLAREHDHLTVRGFVTDVERYFAAADVIVTKPGGLSTAEALAVGRPLILTRPIPGQEEGNIRVLRDAGVASEARDPAALRRAVEDAFADPLRLQRITAAAAALGRPWAADEIVRHVRTRGTLGAAA